jgi:hypothetical protein
MTMEQMHSPTLGALAKALAAAQASLKDAKKDATNPHFKNRYASLSSVRDALQLVLPKHGLSTVQTTAPHGDAGVCVVTWLLHESGEWIRGELFLPVAKKDPQAFGSALSYARRYALAAIVGISSDEDDDAQTATMPARPFSCFHSASSCGREGLLAIVAHMSSPTSLRNAAICATSPSCMKMYLSLTGLQASSIALPHASSSPLNF